jgi:type II secretory pathway pseudopilin PulG
MKLRWLWLVCVAALSASAQPSVTNYTGKAVVAKAADAQGQTNSAAIASAHAEAVRKACVDGRRVICGRVLKVVPGGLVVDSGYTNLLRAPLNRSWVAPSTVTVSRDPNAVELNMPGAPCYGLVFLTDTPKRKQPKEYDYVAITGYPAGQYIYTPAPNVEKTIRKFSGGLETAVKLTLAAERDENTKHQAPTTR